VGLVLWVATVESGLHPAIAGMAAGLLVGAYSPRRDEVERAAAISSAFRQSRMPRIGRSAAQSLQRVISINERAQEALHPISGFVIVPLFALANAGVDLRGGLLEDALGSPVTWGVILGLVVGKLAGISLASLGAARLGLGTVLEGVGNGQVVGGAALSGIGFTVSLLIAGLAFSSPQLQDEATVGVLVAGVLSFALGWVAFRLAAVLRGETTATRPMLLDRAVTSGRDHVRGPAAALLTLVEYGDFECPFCGAATGVVRELRQRFGDDMRYVFRHLPLTDVHPHAELAAAASEAAAAQGRFWEMHDVLFEHQDELQLEDLIGYAGKLDLDTEEFTRALTEGRYDERVREDAMSAEASGARGTPTFFVGHMRHEGAFDTASLARKLELLRPDTLLPMFEPLDAPDGEAAGLPTP
jgi:protein-disulfide isomerase